MSFDYFYGQQSDLFTFYRVPKVLFTNERFWNISADAKIDALFLSTTNIRFISFYRLSHSNLDRARIVCAGDSDVVRSSLKLNGNASAGRFRKYLLLQVRGDVNELTVPIKRIKLVSDYNFTALIFLEVGVSNQNILSVKFSYRSVIGGQKSIVVRSPAALKRLIRGIRALLFPITT